MAAGHVKPAVFLMGWQPTELDILPFMFKNVLNCYKKIPNSDISIECCQLYEYNKYIYRIYLFF